MTVWQRIKSSPVVQIQLVTIIATLVVFFVPTIEPQVKVVVVAATAIINAFAGLNNPTDPKNF